MSEYAPEYTSNEKKQYLIKVCAFALPVVLVFGCWFAPWFHRLITSANCSGINSVFGLNLTVYGIFVGMPVLAGIVLFAVMGPNLMKSIKLSQHPLPGEKVLSKTKYIYGSQARARAYIMLFILSSTFIVAVQGFFWAKELLYLLLYSSVPSCI
ncbi:hypothetical protein TDB9533_03302 [Thalassocella blandensis]|nr:hypothetical protein TDB9533_03302 [Thalassocella blandensis]